MGMIKDTKATMLATAARKAADAGRRYFTPFLNHPVVLATQSGAIDDWAIMIEAIEGEGWVLRDWAIGQDAKGKPQAYPLFVRA